MSGSHLSIKCLFCDVSLFTFAEYCHHLKLFHENEQGFIVPCHIQSCKKTFKTVERYKQHNYRNHGTKKFVNLTDTPEGEPLETVNVIKHPGSTSGAADVVKDYVEQSASNGKNNVVSNYKKHAASFILNLKENHMLPDCLIECLTSELDFFVQFTEEHYRSSIQKGLVELGANALDSETFSSLLGEDTQFELHKLNLNTKFKFKKFIEQNFPYVAPKKYLLSPHSKESKYTYVPITDIIKTVFPKPGFQEIINKYQHQTHHPDALYGTCDGSISKNSDDDSLQLKIQLYVDEFELCNPIGAKRGKHKLTAAYFTIGNVPLRYRNQDMIFLCLLVPHRSLKLFDPLYQEVFQPLLDDLHTLHEGININVNGKDQKITAVLELIMGDNLSSHAIAGFQTNFNSGSICRYCSIKYSNFRDTLTIAQLRPRTNEIYENEIKYIDVDKADAALYGLKHKCAFSKLGYFKVPDSFPPDIMHDCLEGVIPLTVYLVLKSLHSQKLITIDGLNSHLCQLSIPTSDKPNFFKDTFFSTGKIVGSASQKLELFLILPQLVNLNLVSESEAWDVYLTLRACMDYILSPVIEKEFLPHLGGLIESYIYKFKEAFGSELLIPKHHYMMHIPSLILKFGPLRNLWCMSFEAKHQYFKRLTGNTRNCINTTHTLAERHQMKLAYALDSTNYLLYGSEPKAAVKQLIFDILPQTLKMTIQEKLGKPISGNTHINSVKALKDDGVLFKINISTCHILDFIREVPCFGQIKYILFLAGNWYFCLKVYFPVKFVETAHAYEIECQPSWIVVLPQELADSHKHRIYRRDGKTYAYMLYHVTEFHKDL